MYDKKKFETMASLCDYLKSEIAKNIQGEDEAIVGIRTKLTQVCDLLKSEVLARQSEAAKPSEKEQECEDTIKLLKECSKAELKEKAEYEAARLASMGIQAQQQQPPHGAETLPPELMPD